MIFKVKGCLSLTSVIFKEFPALNANSVNPERPPFSTASDLVLPVCQCPFHWTLGINRLISSVQI